MNAIELYKYQGAGNDFLIADNRVGTIRLDANQIAHICDRRYGVGADGLMLLENAEPGFDFRMVYYNSDGSGGMMCGNGGRCIVAFADRCGYRSYRFVAADGPHEAQILHRAGDTLTVKLKMKDVNEMRLYTEPEIDGCFLDTGTRHLVCRVDDIDKYDVYNVGRRKRYLETFGPVGVNVNFIESAADTLKVRTYEKGVEDETYACGTGITASAIANWHFNHPEGPFNKLVHQPIQALKDKLAVDFVPTAEGAEDVYLTGPATYIARIIIDL